METGTHSPRVSRLVAALGQRVIVANARKLRAISQSQTKSDTEDARMLARLGRAGPTLLGPITHGSVHCRKSGAEAWGLQGSIFVFLGLPP